MNQSPYVRRRPVIEEIEPRILFSADVAPLLPDAAPPVQAVEHRVVDDTGEFIGEAAPEQQARRQEVAFVDTATPDYNKLVADIEAQSGPERQLHVVLLDAHADGIQQISSVLAGMKDVSAIHIIGHGADGAVQLGDTTLNLTTLVQNAARIQGWGQSLAPGADLLLYGCDVAQAADGRALVDALGRLTGADVAASVNLTGSAARGADWILEYHTGHIDTQLAISAAEQAEWGGLLDTAVGTPTTTTLSSTSGPAADASPGTGTLLPSDPAATTASVQAQIASTPLAFEQNVGQADAQVDYLARGNGYALALTGGDAILGIQNGDASQVVRLNVAGANANLVATGENLLAAKSNYMIGGEGDWHTNIANYGGVRYDNVYDGVDVRYYGNASQLEYDFIVKPGADPSMIKLSFDGVQSLVVADNGDLVLKLDSVGHSISFKAPIAYQDGPSGHEAVACRYRIEQDGSIGFDVGGYDAGRALVIDPVLSYATYFGGSGSDVATGVAVDPAGNVYLTGYTASSGLLGGLLGLGGNDSVFVTKFSPSLGSALYSSYIGGNNSDEGAAITVDAGGNAYVTGYTKSSNFPTVSAFQGSLNGAQDAFVLKLNASGSALTYSTYLGGSGGGDIGYSIAIDNSGSAYVTGFASSNDFPTTVGAADRSYAGGDAFAVKFSPTGGALVYSTLIGGSNSETGYGIVVDAAGNAVVVGQTASNDLPTTGNAFQTTYGGGKDAFVTELNATGTAYLYSSYLGGSGADVAYMDAVDSSGKIYVTGETGSNNFTVTPGAFQTGRSGANDIFVSIIDPSLVGTASLVYSTFLGGNGANDAGLGIGVDAAGCVYVAGQTDSNNFPVTPDAHQTGRGGGADSFVALLNPLGTGAGDLLYGSYLGGSGSDNINGAFYSNGKLYVAGDTSSNSGIATSGASDTTENGGTDAFAAVFTFNAPPVISTTAAPLGYIESSGPIALDSGLTDADSDSVNLTGATIQITANYANGEDLLSFNNVNAWGITGNWNAATATLSLSGASSVANYQAALRSVTYQNTSENPSTSSRGVSITANDGALNSAAAVRQITVTAVNDPPTIVAQSGTTTEDTPLIFSVANGDPVSIADVDAGAGSIQVTVTSTNGVLTLAQTSGLMFVTGNGSGNATMTFTGTLTSLNAALDGLRFDPNANFNGSAALSIVTNDQGNNGSGGPMSAATSVAISVTAVNDAPVNSVPGPQSTQENAALLFSAASGNAISVSDVDAGTADIQVTLTPTNGTLSLGSTTTLSSIALSGGSIVITGSLGSLNSALDGLTFTPTASFTGAASVQIATDDLGNSGAGGALSTTSTVAITVSADVAPILTLAGSALAYTENDPATMIAPTLTVSDADSPLLDHAIVRISGNYASGQDVLAFTNQAGITGSWDASTGTLTLTGAASAASYQTALRAVTYCNLIDNPSTALRTVSFVANDGISDSAIATAAVSVTAVNDAPVNTAPSTQTTNEDTALVFSAANANEIRIADADAGAAPVKVTLTASSGKLTLAQVVGLTIGGTGNGSGSMTLIGSVDDINAALNGLRFNPAADFNGAVSVHIATEDQGNTGTGGTLSAGATIAINVLSVNDAPAGADRTVTTLEDTGYVFAASDFGFSDTHDAPTANNLLAVRVATLPAVGQLTDNGSAVFSGQFISLSDLAAGKLVYTPGSDGSGAAYASFTFQVQDDGGIANGGVDVDPTPNTITLNVTPVNDAPQGMDATVTTNEDAPYVFAAVDFGFSDTLDSPENQLLAVNIATLPVAGVLSDNGVAVTVGQFVSASDIASGKLQFAPGANASGSGYASFTFQVQDDGGTANGGIDLDPTSNTISVNVASVNDAPQGTSNTVTTLEDTAYTFAAADFGFTDPSDSPANALLAVKMTTLPAAGTLTDNDAAVTAGQYVSVADINGGKLVFTPAANANGTAYASFTFQVQDSGGTASGGIDIDSIARAMTVNVTAIDDAPVIAVDTGTTATQGSSAAITTGSLAATDVDNTNTQLVYTVNAVPTSGMLLLNGVAVAANGTFTQADIASGLLSYQNNGGTSAADSFTFTISDGAGGSVGPATFSITIAAAAPISQPPAVIPPVVTPPVVAPAPPPVVVSPPPTTPSTPPTSSTPSTSAPTGSVDAGGGASASNPAPSPSPPQETAAAPVGASAETAPQANGQTSAARAVNVMTASDSRAALIAAAKMQAAATGMTVVTPLPAGVIAQESPNTDGQVGTLTIGSMQVGHLPESSMPQLEAFRTTLGNKSWVGELDRIRSAADNQIKVEHKVVGSTVAISGAMSVGYVMWLLRGGLLLSSLLSSMPAWHVIDPLPVLAGGKRREEDDGGDDPLERLFGRAKAAVGISREPPAASAADIPVLTDNPDDAVPIGVAS